MLNVIIGNNAIGKTFELYKIINSNQCNVNNFEDIIQYDRLKYVSEDIIEEIEDEMEVSKIILTRDICICNNGEIMQLSRSFTKNITLLLKDAPIIVLDNPDNNLNSDEVLMLCSVLKVISYYKDVWITTHCLDIIPAVDYKLYTVENGHLVDGDKYYDFLI